MSGWVGGWRVHGRQRCTVSSVNHMHAAHHLHTLPIPRPPTHPQVLHGSGPNSSQGWRRAYVLAFRTNECIAEERSLGFTHSHNDTARRAVRVQVIARAFSRTLTPTPPTHHPPHA